MNKLTIKWATCTDTKGTKLGIVYTNRERTKFGLKLGRERSFRETARSSKALLKQLNGLAPFKVEFR